MSEEETVTEKKELAQLRMVANRFELTYPEYDLVIRGPYAEWVLEAAAEVVGRTEMLQTSGSIEELELLSEFDESLDTTEIDSLKYEAKTRFKAVPQCIVSMGENDYRWIHESGRTSNEHSGYGQRLYDHSLTREQGSWLVDEEVQ
ncbi:MAG: hypothetical protein AAF720_01885 [Pseudomonadota bacterium]